MTIENPILTHEQKPSNLEYVSEQKNRELIKHEFEKAIELTLSEFNNQTGDSNYVFDKIKVPFQLDPPVVLAMTTISSDKIEYFSIDWTPLKKNLTRTMLMIRDEYRAQGLGEIMNSVTEEIAKKLGCKSVTVQAIVDTSLDYWKNKSDYEFTETNRSATKYF